jgi:hypothetical protein
VDDQDAGLIIHAQNRRTKESHAPVFLEGGCSHRMMLSAVTIQITLESQPSIPSWMGEVTVFAQVLSQTGRIPPRVITPTSMI